MYVLKRGVKKDPQRRWNLPDRIFFGYGACHILAGAFLAAAYGFGLARNHPFVDGNKRTAFVAVELFLALNGRTLVAGDVECVLTMLQLAAGELDESQFAQWVRDKSQPA